MSAEFDTSANATERPSFFLYENGHYVPTGLGISPWNGRTQGGMSLAGLLAYLLETVPMPVPMVAARMTIDILGAAPMAPLEGATRLQRDGRKQQLVEAELRTADRIWARAQMLRIRTEETPPAVVPATFPALATLPEEDVLRRNEWHDGTMVETARLKGNYIQRGPGAMWSRIKVAAVAGHPISPLQRMAMTADCGNAVGPLLELTDWSLANLDISLHMTRMPRSEWLLIDSHGVSAGNGLGINHAMIGDDDGMFAIAHQTLFVDRRI